MRCTFFVLALGAAIVLAGCKLDKEVVVDDLLGTWEVIAAERDGRATETVNGAYFDFRPDGYLVTNITGRQDRGSFTIENMHIQHQGLTQAEYKINAFGADSMSLEVILYKMEFVLDLHRKQTE